MSSAANIPADCDVLVAGGGPVGSALAVALADGRRRIVVVEAQAGPPGGDARATVLADGSVRLLDALGVWAGLAGSAVPVRRVEVSRRGYFGRTRIDAAEEGVAALGHVVSHDELATALAAAARDAPGVEWVDAARANSAEIDGDAVRVCVERGDAAGSCAARLVVAADGTRSPLRDALGFRVSVYDYGQVALLATLRTACAPHTAHERFSDGGALALLPAGDRRSTLVWTVAADRADALVDLPRQEFAAAAGRLLGRSVCPVESLVVPVAYPLKMVEADRLVGERAVVVGNAARTLHPVAAQGFNLALRDVCALAEHLAEHDDAGASTALAAWSRARHGDQRRTRAFTHALARYVGHDGWIPAGVQAGTLLGLDLCPAGRHALAAQAMGLLGGLPRVGRWRIRSGA